MQQKLPGTGDLSLCVVPVGPLQANCSVLCHRPTGQCLVVDCGSSVHKVSQAIKSIGGRCTSAVFTHGHYDHIAGARILVEDSQAKTFLHKVRTMETKGVLFFWGLSFVSHGRNCFRQTRHSGRDSDNN